MSPILPASQASLRPTEHPVDGGVLAELIGVSVRLGGKSVLENIHMAVRAGEIVTLVGVNGSGKSTLLKVLLGLRKPDSGEVRRRAGLVVGYTPQHLQRDATLPLSVGRFVALGGRSRRAEVDRVLAEVGLTALKDQPLAAISGGEMNRVVLARALIRDPELLVLDEPMSGVDVTGQSELYRLIAQLRDDRNLGVLLVSHDLHVVMAKTDSVICLNQHICCTGHPTAVVRHPEFLRLFGREASDMLAVYEHDHDHSHAENGEILPIEGDCGHDHRTGAGHG